MINLSGPYLARAYLFDLAEGLQDVFQFFAFFSAGLFVLALILEFQVVQPCVTAGSPISAAGADDHQLWSLLLLRVASYVGLAWCLFVVTLAEVYHRRHRLVV